MVKRQQYSESDKGTAIWIDKPSSDIFTNERQIA